MAFGNRMGTLLQGRRKHLLARRPKFIMVRRFLMTYEATSMERELTVSSPLTSLQVLPLETFLLPHLELASR